jgi:predicted GTPase
MVALAYSDLSYHSVQALASRVVSAGCHFIQTPPAFTQITSTKPVVSIVGSRTGVGKSTATRLIAAHYSKERGHKVAIVKHPMAYGAL